MIKIYWTHKVINGVNKAMAISVHDSGLSFCMSDPNPPAFNTVEEADFYIKEACKPLYFKEYGLNYELIYLECDSEEWYEVHANYHKTLDMLYEFKEMYIDTPVWKQVIRAYWNKLVALVK